MANSCDTPPEIEQRLPPSLKKALTGLLSQESKILQKLNSDPKLAQTFIQNPGAALAQMGIKLDPELASALGTEGRPSPFVPKTFKLPDGSAITPSINITFVRHEKAKGT